MFLITDWLWKLSDIWFNIQKINVFTNFYYTIFFYKNEILQISYSILNLKCSIFQSEYFLWKKCSVIKYRKLKNWCLWSIQFYYNNKDSNYLSKTLIYKKMRKSINIYMTINHFSFQYLQILLLFKNNENKILKYVTY